MLQFVNNRSAGSRPRIVIHDNRVYPDGGLCIRATEIPSRENELISGGPEGDSPVLKESGFNPSTQPEVAVLAESSSRVANEAWTQNKSFCNHIVDGTKFANSCSGLDS